MVMYDLKDKESIYNYAKKLEGKTFRDVCREYDNKFISFFQQNVRENYAVYENKKRKGGLGELIEDRYFNYSPNNVAEADFPEAEVELKVTPYKVNKDKTISAKERLIISMISYHEIIEIDFFDSYLWNKIKNILIIYYKWEEGIENRLDYTIDFVYMFSPSGEDLTIIKNDFYKIKNKVAKGNAHELSEGDTLYLGAATKASTSRDRRSQPNSNIPAKPRAFSLKNSYMTYVLRNYILKDKKISDKKKLDKIIKEHKPSQLKEDLDFDLENYIINILEKYYNKKTDDLFKLFFQEKKISSKNKYSRLVFRILGVKSNNAEEFVKANIVVKSIRVEENNNIIESMSFPSFEIKKLVKEIWENSNIYNYFSETKFLFIVYKKKGKDYYLKGAKFWNMPTEDIEGSLKNEWVRTQNIFKDGVEFIIKDDKSPIRNNLPKKNNTKILHVRPHARMSAYLINDKKYGNGSLKRDTDLLPNGDRMTKQSFWLNNDYILKQVKDLIKT